MKRIVGFLLLSLLLVSCGKHSGYFKIDGRLLHVNQGQLFVYSPDGVMDGLDTIQIKGGRFAYEVSSMGHLFLYSLTFLHMLSLQNQVALLK